MAQKVKQHVTGVKVCGLTPQICSLPNTGAWLRNRVDGEPHCTIPVGVPHAKFHGEDYHEVWERDGDYMAKYNDHGDAKKSGAKWIGCFRVNGHADDADGGWFNTHVMGTSRALIRQAAAKLFKRVTPQGVESGRGIAGLADNVDLNWPDDTDLLCADVDPYQGVKK